MSRRSKQLSALVIASALVVAACGDDDDSSSSGDSSSADESELTVAAESGNPEARLQLYWHDTGEGMYWLCRAANQGYPKARYRVAQLYEFGDDGVNQDLVRAYMWYDLAAQACHPWARKDYFLPPQAHSHAGLRRIDAVHGDSLRQHHGRNS